MTFDTDIFINEVSFRRPLWDINLKDYSNRDVKSKLWIEVATIVIEGWEQLPNEDKNKEVKELQKKWKSLRDAFSREIRNQKMPSGSSAKRRRKYCYFDQLLFLVGTIDDGKSTTSLQETPSSPHNYDEQGNELSVSNEKQANQEGKIPASKKRYKQTPFEVSVLKHLQEKKVVDEEEEADKNFLLSFLPIFKKLPLEKKLSARVSITQVMQKAAKPDTMTPHYQPPQNPMGNFPNQYQSVEFQHPSQRIQFQSTFNEGNIFHGSQAPYAIVVSPSSTSDSTSNTDVFSVINEDLTQLNGIGDNN